MDNSIKVTIFFLIFHLRTVVGIWASVCRIKILVLVIGETGIKNEFMILGSRFILMKDCPAKEELANARDYFITNFGLLNYYLLDEYGHIRKIS